MQIPGTPLPYKNEGAPACLDLDPGATVHLEIIGRSENYGHDADA